MASGTTSGEERRGATRKRVEGSLSLVDLGPENGGLMLDLSEGGLALQTVFPVSAESAVPIRFELPETNISIHATAAVAWVKNSKQVGLRFTEIPVNAQQQIRQWLKGGPKFQDAFTESLPESTLVYSDAPEAEPEPLSAWEAEKTVRYVPDFARTDSAASPAAAAAAEAISEFDDLPEVQPIEDLAALSEHAAQATIRYVPKFVTEKTARAAEKETQKETKILGSIETVEQHPVTVREHVATIRVKPEVVAAPQVRAQLEIHPAQPAAANTQLSYDDVSALVGRQLAAKMAEPLAMIWNSPGYLKRLRSLSPAGRRHMLQELEFQARAMSLWMLEINAGSGPNGGD
jgi:hypothetical protein